MDIQFAYNLERMLFYALGQDSARVAHIMQRLEAQFHMEQNAEGVQLPADVLASIQSLFQSVSVSDEDTLRTIRQVYDEHQVEICPHSAVGVCAARTVPDPSGNTRVCVLTAHPAKFESAITKALGRPPALPPALAALKTLPHKFKLLDKSAADWKTAWAEAIKADIEEANRD